MKPTVRLLLILIITLSNINLIAQPAKEHGQLTVDGKYLVEKMKIRSCFQE